MEYKLGAFKNPKDLRDIKLTQVQSPVVLPDKFITDISWIPVFNQKRLGACVGHSHALIHTYYEMKENGVNRNLSPRYIYAWSKKFDGLPQEGTYPRIAAKIECNKGCATDGFCPNNTDLSHNLYINVPENEETILDAKPFKMKGYAEVASDKEALKQALVQNGLVAITISVGNFSNPILPGNLGLHRVTLYGYEGDRFYYRNSWGKNWGDNGNGYFDWGTQKLIDCMVFVDLPNEIKEKAKKKYKYFTEKEVKGLKPELVELLDKLRGECGFPFIINSGFRTKAKNNSLSDTVKDSAHLEGLAVDLSISDSFRRFILINKAILAGISRIGIGKNFIHIDISKTLPQSVIWLYN